MPVEPTPLRRTPQQDRAKVRVEQILTESASLLAQHGVEALRMSKIAETVGISIGSLYQYFPDRGSVIRSLAERFNAVGQVCVAEALAGVRTMTELELALARVVDEYYQMCLDEPAMPEIWSATQADRALQDIDEDDIRAHARNLAAALRRVRKDLKPKQASEVAFLVMQLTAATVRIAVRLPRPEARRMLDRFARMATSALHDGLG